MPFSNLSGDYVGANSVLAGATQLTGSDITNGEAENFVKTFTDVTIPSGDIAFLFYGKAKHDAAYKGVLEMTPDASVTSLTPADIAFTLKNITEGTYTGGSYSTAAALIEAWKTNVTDALATYVSSLTEGEENYIRITLRQQPIRQRHRSIIWRQSWQKMLTKISPPIFRKEHIN